MRVTVSLATWVTAALLILAPTARGGEAPKVLIAGESISRLTMPYLLGTLSGSQLTRIEAAGSASGVREVKRFHDPTLSVLVFDTGTNDGPARSPLARNLRRAARLIGEDTCMVVPTLDSSASGANNDAKSEAVFEFAASRPGTQVPEWAGVVDMRPNLRLIPDGFHQNHPAATYRAGMIARAVRACLNFESGKTEPPEPDSSPTWLSPVSRVDRQLESTVITGGL